MMVPSGMVEDDVLTVIESVVNLLAPSFVFGYYDVDDIKQCGRMEAWKVLPKFDPTRGKPSQQRNNVPDRLYNFLRQHVKNRYINLLRDEYERKDKGTTELNERKKSLAAPLSLMEEHYGNSDKYLVHDDVETEIDINYYRELIYENLPAQFITDYHRMEHGVSLPKCRRVRVEQAIAEIIGSGVL